MSYLHTIATGRDLFSRGHFDAIEEIFVPLLDRGDLQLSEEATVRCLLAGTLLLGRGDAARALALLSPLRVDGVPERLGESTRAETLVWLGWARAEVDDSGQDWPHVLSLFAIAAAIADGHGAATLSCWANLGYARGFLAAGSRELAKPRLHQARLLAHALEEGPAIRIIDELLRDNDDLRRDVRESKQPRKTASMALLDSLEAVELAFTAGLPLLVVGEKGVGKRRIAREEAARVGRDVYEIKCRRYDRGEAAKVTESMLSLTDRSVVLLLSDVDRLLPDDQHVLEGQLISLEDRTEVSVQLVSTATHEPAAFQHSRPFLPSLLSRIASVRASLPALRRRRYDVEVLARSELRANSPGAPRAAITDRALSALQRYEWSGNDAELREILAGLRHSLSVDPSPVVDTHHLPHMVREPVPSAGALRLWIDQQHAADRRALDDVLAEAERALIESTLHETGGQVTAAADMLGLTRQGLYKKIKRLDVDAGRFQIEDEHAVHDNGIGTEV